MRLFYFWFGLVGACLAALLDPVWGYRALFALALLQVFMISRSRENIFLLIHYVTVLIYFSIAPAVQIHTGTDFWRVGLLDSPAHFRALTILLAYMAGIELASQLSLQTPPVPRIQAQPASFSHTSMLLITVISMLAFAALFARPSLNFVARGAPSEEDIRPFQLILFSTLPKTLVLLGFVALAINAVNTRGSLAIAAALLVFAAACAAANPINTARQVILIGLLPLLIHLLAFRRKLVLAAMVFGVVAGIGPVLNFLSRDSFYDGDISSFPTSPDFDAMFIIAGVLDRAPGHELGYGRYLLSAFSFIIPRDLKLFPDFDPLGWPAVGANFSQANVSFPPFATAYLDFGFIGPIMLGLAVGKTFQMVQRAISAAAPSQTVLLIGLVMCAAYIPFLRGPILGWGPFAIAGVISAFIIGALAHSPTAKITHRA